MASDAAAASDPDPATEKAPTFSIARELADMEEVSEIVVREQLGQLDALTRAMTSYGVRDDSRLAFKFATGQLPPQWTPHAVAHELACTQWLSDAVPYHAQLPSFLRGLADATKAQSGVRDWKRVWAAVRELGPEIAKLDYLMRARAGVPDFVPQAPPPQAPHDAGPAAA